MAADVRLSGKGRTGCRALRSSKNLTAQIIIKLNTTDTGRFAPDICGHSRDEALATISLLEQATLIPLHPDKPASAAADKEN